MRNGPLWRVRILLGVLVLFAMAHGATPLANPRVRALGDKLLCKCGCNASITGCNMLQCHFSDPVRQELLTMVEAGKTDQEILDAMVAEYGQDILLRPPAQGFFLLGYVMPYVGLAAGLGLLLLVLRHYLKRRPAPASGPADLPGEPPELERYRAKIEKDLSDLDQ
jgi:cytochrome c-type biogenesis protein CcmH